MPQIRRLLKTWIVTWQIVVLSGVRCLSKELLLSVAHLLTVVSRLLGLWQSGATERVFGLQKVALITVHCFD